MTSPDSGARCRIVAILAVVVALAVGACGGGAAAPPDDLAFAQPGTEPGTPGSEPGAGTTWPPPGGPGEGGAAADEPLVGLVAIDRVVLATNERRSVEVVVHHAGEGVDDVRLRVEVTGALVVSDGVSLVRMGPGEQTISVIELAGIGVPGTLTVSALARSDPSRGARVSVDLVPGTPTGSPPVAADNSARAVAGQETVVYVVGADTDPDGDLELSSMELVGGGFLAGSLHAPGNGTIVYTPFADAEGTDVVLYKICDAEQRCDTAAVRIVVTPAP